MDQENCLNKQVTLACISFFIWLLVEEKKWLFMGPILKYFLTDGGYQFFTALIATVGDGEGKR